MGDGRLAALLESPTGRAPPPRGVARATPRPRSGRYVLIRLGSGGRGARERAGRPALRLQQRPRPAGGGRPRERGAERPPAPVPAPAPARLLLSSYARTPRAAAAPARRSVDCARAPGTRPPRPGIAPSAPRGPRCLPGTLGGHARPAPWSTGLRASANSSGSSRP